MNAPTTSTWAPGLRSRPAKTGRDEVVAHVTTSASRTAARLSRVTSTGTPRASRIRSAKAWERAGSRPTLRCDSGGRASADSGEEARLHEGKRRAGLRVAEQVRGVKRRQSALPV